MTIDASQELASFPLDQAIQQLEVRASDYGSLFRCIMCRKPLSEESNQAIVVFDPHFGHKCGESGPVLAGLTHLRCRIESVYPYSQKDLPRFIHHQHGFYGRRSADAPTGVMTSTLLFDVLWVQPDGSTEEPWLTASLANGSSRIDNSDQLLGRVGSAPNGWIELGDKVGSVNTGGQTVFDFAIDPGMSEWLGQARQEGSMLFVQSSLQPLALGESEANSILQPTELHRALGEIVQHEPLAAVSLPVRTETAKGKGAGRNEPCPCLSGMKFKKCCSR